MIKIDNCFDSKQAFVVIFVLPKWNRVEKDVHWFGAIRPSADNQRPENVKWRNWDLK